MGQGLVDILLALGDVSSPEGCKLSTDHVVILDDGETYPGAEGARVWLGGKGYLITELLDFYLASVQEVHGDFWKAISCPCGSDEHSILDCPVDDWQ